MDSILLLFGNDKNGEKRWLFLLFSRIPKKMHKLQKIEGEIKYIKCQQKLPINIFCHHQKEGDCEEDVHHLF